MKKVEGDRQGNMERAHKFELGVERGLLTAGSYR